jgi:hypothetical protein
MTKSRIDRRGKIGTLVRKFPPDGRLHWKKAKALAVQANKKQWEREFDPVYTVETEIVSGEGYGIILESTTQSLPTYIVVE